MTANRMRRVITIGLVGLAFLLLVPIGPAAAAPPATATLNIWIDGWGSGTVTSSPPGINCQLSSPAGYPYFSTTDYTLSGPCEAQFPVGTVVTTNRHAGCRLLAQPIRVWRLLDGEPLPEDHAERLQPGVGAVLPT
jgi:hypothetical protein